MTPAALEFRGELQGPILKSWRIFRSRGMWRDSSDVGPPAVQVEGREPHQERFTVLQNRNRPCRHRPPVSDPAHDHFDRSSGHASSDESDVQRVGRFTLDGRPRADERLRQELPAVNAIEHLSDVGRDAEVVYADLLHVES